MFIFSKRPARSRRTILEVEILEDRLPLSASPLHPLVLPLTLAPTPPTHIAPLVAATTAASHTNSGGNTNAALPPQVGTALPTFNPLGPTGQSNGTPTSGQPIGIFGFQPSSLTLSSPLNANPTSLNTTPGQTATTPLTMPFAGAQQQSSAGQALVDKTRQISGIDSRVFDARSQDRLILRDQREIRGMGDESGLVLQPPPVPVPTSPSMTPSETPGTNYPQK